MAVPTSWHIVPVAAQMYMTVLFEAMERKAKVLRENTTLQKPRTTDSMRGSKLLPVLSK